jgi:adenosine deaminase
MNRVIPHPDELSILPKVELHRHLEGSMRLRTCLELARQSGLALPTDNTESIRPYVQYCGDQPDFQRFLGLFEVLDQLYGGKPEPVRRVARDAVLDAAADGIRYLELRFNPDHFARRNGASLDDVARWITESANEAAQETGVMLRFIITVPRHYPLVAAERLAQVAVDYREVGIRGLDLAGDEINYPWEPFVSLFREAHRAGLGLTIHAGEVGPSKNVEAALTAFEAPRIGHGVAIAHDERVLDHVLETGTTLEICPTSNLQTGAVRVSSRSRGAHPASDHPLPYLYRRGVRVTLNTDDPGISDITLSHECLLVMQQMGLRSNDLRRMMRNAVNAAFLSDEEKSQLLDDLLRQWDACEGA